MAGHQARAGGARYIFTGPGLASCRRRPLSSNVRPPIGHHLPQSHIKTSLALFVAFFMAQATAADKSDLRVAVMKADESLFAAVFDSCDPAAVAALTAEDFEFIHDKWGQIAKSRDEFVKAISGSCERQKQGTDFKATRRLINSSIAIYRMKDYGVLQTGEHQFYRVEKDGTLSPTEYAKFTHLWREENGRLLLAKVISYAHIDGSRPAGTQ